MYIYVSIDPGTQNLGLTVNGIDMLTGEKRVLHSATINIERLADHLFSETVIPIHGLRQAKMMTVHRTLVKFLTAWQPQQVVSESPYMGRFPQAFSALVECITAIRQALYEYNPQLPLITIDPATIKKAVGVKGNSGDKNAMTRAVANLVGSTYDISYLDEHAIDSIAVGHAWYILHWSYKGSV